MDGTSKDSGLRHDGIFDSEPDDAETLQWRAVVDKRQLNNADAATAHIAKDKASPEQILRRLSLSSPSTPSLAKSEAKTEVTKPASNTSGRVINAVFCIPHTVSLTKQGQWNLKSRHGTSALFDSLAYLASSDSPWDQTIVGWTGEIKSCSDEQSDGQNGFPSPSHRRSARQGHSEELCVSRAEREDLEDILEHHKSGKISPVWLLDELQSNADVAILKDQARWRRYAEHELYTLFHYKQGEPSDGRAARLWWADYYRTNQLFADRIEAIYRPGDIIWIHDYHLMLLPNILRQRLPKAYIGFFLHIPFPSSELLRCLSRRKEILEGALGANMIGFQSYGYSRHFVSCCKRILRFESSLAGIDAYGARVAIDVFPIGIHAASIQYAAFNDPEVDAKIRGIRELYPDKKIIVGRDRLDTVRGVAQKLQAFEVFLEKYPEWRDKVVLIQVTSPTSVEEEKEDAANKIANKVSDLVSRINGTYGSLSFSPVQHYPQYISREEYLALLRIADVGLITSVRDGMNTTSLEYVVCQKDQHGPLILSEFSGTAGSLSDAMHINPWDLVGVAKCIRNALEMSEVDKQSQHTKLYNHVTTNTVQAWTNKFLARLISTVICFGLNVATPTLDKTKLLARFRTAKKRLFMFDYDGTLTPIVKDPQSAIPSDRVIRTLKTLASDSRNAVWIISGRDQAFLDEWMGHIPELGLSAEHGCFIRQPKSQDWENVTEKFDMSWQQDVLAVFQHFTDLTQGSFIEQKKVALTWHYRSADPEFGAYQADECRKRLESTVAQKFDVEVMAGKANLEVRPRFVNKGEIAKRLIGEYSTGVEEGPSPGQIHVASGPEFVFCLGDDATDEDMFRALNASDLPRGNFFTCTVGASSKQTLAASHLLEPADVISAISLLNGTPDEANAGVFAILDNKIPMFRGQ